MASLQDAGFASFEDPVVSLCSTTGYRLGSRRDHPDRPVSDHFVGVNKMVPAAHSERCAGINAEARELEERIAENVAEILEA
jgi:hypothetical protein